MSPQIQRPGHPYVQIADHYRQLITAGDLQPGTRLPTVTTIANEWGVSPGTAHKAIRLLAGERLVDPTQQGTWVLGTRATPTPRDRVGRVHRGDEEPGDVSVTAAERVTAPDYVADLLGLDTGAQVIRRESITRSATGSPTMLTVVWVPAAFADRAPELVEDQALDEAAVIHDRVGRTITHGRDWVTGRDADKREARALDLDVGSPITAGTWLWSDERGVVEYGEYVMPANHVVSYEYSVDASRETR